MQNAPPGGSQMQLPREESSRKPSGHTHVYPPRVLAHSPCWQRPPVAHSSTSARIEGVFGELGTTCLAVTLFTRQALAPRCPLPTQDPLTLSKPVGHGPFGPFTRLEFPVQKGGVGAETGWQTDNRAVLKKDYVGRAKRSEVWFEYQISLPLAA